MPFLCGAASVCDGSWFGEFRAKGIYLYKLMYNNIYVQNIVRTLYVVKVGSGF